MTNIIGGVLILFKNHNLTRLLSLLEVKEQYISPHKKHLIMLMDSDCDDLAT
jgi:hypothetical protein